MNLKKLFNYKYLFQNVKKSAQLLSIFVGLVPILNTIFLILKATSTSGGYLASLEDISAFTIIGMYILPYILVACLFDFMFKKRSVDFIGSMPISKKSIFVTNMIGGGMIIVVMLLISTILMGMTSLIFPNIYLPFGMLVDYFLIFLVGYLFIPQQL
jgi:ABC-type transport system involved in multi-copper enzyme maturation permease subunit